MLTYEQIQCIEGFAAIVNSKPKVLILHPDWLRGESKDNALRAAGTASSKEASKPSTQPYECPADKLCCIHYNALIMR